MKLDEIRRIESEPVPPVRSDDGGFSFYGWAPYDLGTFGQLVGIAAEVASGCRFVDAGCGIGTKCLAASAFGLPAHGIDRVPQYVEAARRYGVSAEVADVRDWGRYGEFDIVYVSHPLRDVLVEAAFEEWLFGQMKPGAVFVSPRVAARAPVDWSVAHEEEYRRDYDSNPRRQCVYVKGVGNVG